MRYRSYTVAVDVFSNESLHGNDRNGTFLRYNGGSMNTDTRELRLSEIFQQTLDTNNDGLVVLGEVLERAGDRGYGFLLVLLAVPAFIPVLPPGTSGVLGLLITLVALQMLIGIRQPWIPPRWRHRQISPRTVELLKTRGVAVLQKVEKISHPRGRRFARNSIVLRISALIVIALALVLSSPMPFMNTLPAFGILFIGIGLANHDSYFFWAGALVGAIVATVTFLGVGALMNLWNMMLRLFSGG
jgi:hypothetical protein